MAQGRLKYGVCKLIAKSRFLRCWQVTHITEDSGETLTGQGSQLLFVCRNRTNVTAADMAEGGVTEQQTWLRVELQSSRKAECSSSR